MSSPRPSKRQRIGRACDQCRRRKSKCDGTQPVCAICREADRTCTYQNSGRRRGLQSGYVRSLETVLGIVLQNISGSEATLQSVIRDHDNFLSSDMAERSVKIWRKSKLAKNVDKLLNPDSADPVDARIDDAPEWESMETSDIVMEASTTGLNELPLMPPSINEVKEPDNYLDKKFPDSTAEVLDFYFTHIHSWLPVVERRDMLRVMHTDPHQSSPRDKHFRLVLWAIVACISSMNGMDRVDYPDPMRVQHSIQIQVINDQDTLGLSHAQALLVLALLNIGCGNLYLAWMFIGQAMRILVVLPTAARTHRYKHTFHGCVFVDTMISAVLQRTPCLSLDEQKEHGYVEEDDVDEWDVWAISRDHNGQRSKGPLRALSIFNRIYDLMHRLTRILQFPSGAPSLHGFLVDLRQFQGMAGERYPHTSHCVNPPLLTLHLTLQFVMLTLVRKITMDSNLTELVRNAFNSTLDMLDNYIEMTGTVKSSPLLSCFALQAQRCLHFIPNDEKDEIEDRLSKHLKQLGLGHFRIERPFDLLQPGLDMNTFDQSVSTAANGAIAYGHAFNPTIPNVNFATPVDSASAGLESDDFDALFEEMVTSIPTTRQEPMFAHNLGFYAGDLDTDFLAQLQQPPD
ncbi:hypothetical protein ASPWEDRAFT_110917 [Aspergillus wentii DTO 134E9]|uniref:Zn(2)-C6 fungal-type domain-containing protein n=1 Tax=Aspergillus wentii DTO 134E9 TaxID=1073089 RepID=A0A1L9RLL1_ASPWE|nr:uncharacterized protein ASPWEDRAFT_110917 [Aspergillus wentii DTO 134E9]OJJ35784.1 hypothetical protein ASPWEDRAFT_110917 [Aspergillus wentii DTO 134E9]